MEKLGQVINVDKAYIENLISKHGSVKEAHFETRRLSEYEHERKVAFEVKEGSSWIRKYTESLFPMYVEKCSSGDRIVFGNTHSFGRDTHSFGNEDGLTVYHHYRWRISDYGTDWRLREIINTQYDYSKAKDLFKR